MNRRDLLQGAAVMGIGLGAPRMLAAEATAGAAAETLTLPGDPESQCRAMIRAYGNEGGDPCVWKTRGKVFAVQEDAVTPMYGFLGSETGWWKQVEEHVWVRYPSTVSFFTDLETGEFIDQYTSPFNGATVTLPASFIRHKEGQYYTPMGVWFGSMKRVFPDHYAEKPLHLDWTDDNGVLRLQEGSRFPPILPQPSLEYASLFAATHEVLGEEPHQPTAAAGGWNIFSATRRPYDEMGILPGHVIWHFDAVKVPSFEELDAGYLERARALSPVFEQSPEHDDGPSFFERIIEMRGFG
ncbi:MAG: DUF1838 family protein [Gammaproteobacteria bacterium]|nr:DUF1838 family protein [Gammaproteobacteria bacterium]MDE0414810.1 DUF1838 family protein [Gammaproteobacteria bacterium]MDE0454486.1 DUF1838 family protein [Gammaproteobacteria bacterium]